MIYFLFWISVLIIGFILVTLIKLQSLDDEDLPIQRDEIIEILKRLTIIGTIIFTVSISFINVKNALNQAVKLKLISTETDERL